MVIDNCFGAITDIHSFTIHPDVNLLDGAYTYAEGGFLSIAVTIDARPLPVPSLSKTSAGGMSAVDYSRVFLNSSRIQFLSPLTRNDSGLYTVVLTNPAGTLSESFTIDVHCKCTLHVILINYSS